MTDLLALRDTVRALLPGHDVYVTDWIDAREVPLSQGNFDLDDYIDYVIEMLHALGPNTHVMAVCQPSVPAYAAVALMSALVPALIARKRLGNGPALRPILIRAALFALAGGGLGAASYSFVSIFCIVYFRAVRKLSQGEAK